MVVPITRKGQAGLETAYELPASTEGLRADSVALVHLIQPVHRREFLQRGQRLGHVSHTQLAQILTTLAWAVGMGDVLSTESY